jgi:TIR domain
MRVAILGSWRDEDRQAWKLTRTADDYARACRELGQALARLGHTVVGGGKSADTADYHVVQGILEIAGELSSASPLVEVIRPANEDVAYGDDAAAHPRLFQWRNPTEPNWGDAHMLAIGEADVVITIGGAAGTYLEGLAVLRLSTKRLVPIASFGGASARLIAKLSGAENLNQEYGQLYGRWTAHTLETALKLAGVLGGVSPSRAAPEEDGSELPRLFISHSHLDERYVEKLIELLRSALPLTAEQIRCTSVPGYRLKAGANVQERLRVEIERAETFVGIISERSLASAFVMFELGARWGAGKHLIPLLAPGTAAGALSGPLDDLNALRGDQGPDLHQLVADLAAALGLRHSRPAAYQRQIDRILADGRSA